MFHDILQKYTWYYCLKQQEMLLLFCKAIFNYVRSLDPLDPLQIWVGD